MLSNELLELVKGLNKVQESWNCCRNFFMTPICGSTPMTHLDCGYNHEAARIMQEMLAEDKSRSQQET